MRLSPKQEIFSQFFFTFLKSTLNFEHFAKKKNLIADLFPKLRTAKSSVNKCLKKSSFRGHFDYRHGEPEEALLKSRRRHV